MEFIESPRNREDTATRIRHLEHQLETERAYGRQLEQERRVLRQALLTDIYPGDSLQHRIDALTKEKTRLDAVCPDTSALRLIIERLQAEQQSAHPAHDKSAAAAESVDHASPGPAIDAMCLHVVREMAQEIGRLQKLLSVDDRAAVLMEEQQALKEDNTRLSRKLTSALDRLAHLEKVNLQIRAQAEMDDERAFNIRRSLDASSSGSSPAPPFRPYVTASPLLHHGTHGSLRAHEGNLGRASPGSLHGASPRS